MSATLFLFTNDLRINDNPALYAACQNANVIPLYIVDTSQDWPIQGAAAWWLRQALDVLTTDLKPFNLDLIIKKGVTEHIIKNISERIAIDSVYVTRSYTPFERQRQKNLCQFCKEKGIKFHRFSGTLLFEPEAIANQQGQHFQVFTPFYKHCMKKTPRQTLKKTIRRAKPKTKPIASDNLDDVFLMTHNTAWTKKLSHYWQPGEKFAHKQLASAIDNIVIDYDQKRNLMGDDGTSKLSPYLRFGQLSPAHIWEALHKQLSPVQSDAFLRQLLWREFHYHLLFHREDITQSAFKEKFKHFPWRKNTKQLKRWQLGLTGYPIVDAAMNELWETGWMHNRARMIVASFLTKHLLISWREGAAWFWDTLVDADQANNCCGWQWVAGSGADAAPYFRIFNPTTQGKKFDPEGVYTKHWLPSLDQLPIKYLFAPWEAPQDILDNASVRLGENYPLPMVDHKTARERALAAYSKIK